MLIRHHRPTKLQKRKRKAQFFRERAAHSNLQYTMKCSIRQHSVNHLISCLMSLMLLEFNRSPQHLVKLKHSRSTHLTQKTDYNDCILSTHIFLMSFGSYCNAPVKAKLRSIMEQNCRGTMIHIPQQDLIERDGANYLLRGLQASSELRQ